MISHAPDLQRQRPLCAGLPIAVGPDHAGALGGVVYDAETARPLLLSAHHVLWNPRFDGKVWQPAPCGQPNCECNVVGHTLRGKRSILQWREHWYYVDAAVAAIASGVEWDRADSEPEVAGVGKKVWKIGPATGATEGIVVDDRHADSVQFGTFRVDVPNQIRIHPIAGHTRFAADGDSGAMVFDDNGCTIGLLWGADGSGAGVACPIGPVLEALGISLSRGAA